MDATGPMEPPVFFVSVASKGLSHAVSLLFATLARGSISVASKGLTLHQNCAILTLVWELNWGCGEAEEVATNFPGRHSTRETAAWQEKSANTLLILLG